MSDDYVATYALELKRDVGEMTAWYQVEAKGDVDLDEADLREMGVETVEENIPEVPVDELVLAFAEMTELETPAYTFEFSAKVDYHADDNDCHGIAVGGTLDDDGDLRLTVYRTEMDGIDVSKPKTVDRVLLDDVKSVVDDE